MYQTVIELVEQYDRFKTIRLLDKDGTLLGEYVAQCFLESPRKAHTYVALEWKDLDGVLEIVCDVDAKTMIELIHGLDRDDFIEVYRDGLCPFFRGCVSEFNALDFPSNMLSTLVKSVHFVDEEDMGHPCVLRIELERIDPKALTLGTLLDAQEWDTPVLLYNQVALVYNGRAWAARISEARRDLEVLYWRESETGLSIIYEDVELM